VVDGPDDAAAFDGRERWHLGTFLFVPGQGCRGLANRDGPPFPGLLRRRPKLGYWPSLDTARPRSAIPAPPYRLQPHPPGRRGRFWLAANLIESTPLYPPTAYPRVSLGRDAAAGTVRRSMVVPGTGLPSWLMRRKSWLYKRMCDRLAMPEPGACGRAYSYRGSDNTAGLYLTSD
jgi:hypothetical protein